MINIKDFETEIVELEKQFKDLSLEAVEMTEANEDSPQDNFTDFISYLKSAFEQSVVWHHQTNVYSVHKALNKFYDGILDLTDGLIESTSGIYGRSVDYVITQPVNFQNIEQVTAYFQSCYDQIQEDRANIYQETWIQNQVDSVATLFAQTLFLLSLNK